MESLCSRSNVLEENGDTPFSELPLNSSQIGMNNSSHKIHMSNEEQAFVSSEDDSFANGNKNSFQCASELPQENKSVEGTPSTMEKISMLLGAHFPEDSKLLANPKGIIKSYLSVAAANDPDKFDSYRKLCVAHVNEYYKHLKGDAGALCLVCNVPCQHWNTLQRHLQTHINFRPFSCELCGRTFYSQSKLKRHQVIHNDIKPYKCPVCERRLGRPEHLKRHLLVHTDSKPFGCSGCSHTTKRLDGIRRHIKRKHGADGAKIVEIEVPFDSQVLSNVQQAVVSAERPSIALKVKKKKKKKKLGIGNSDPNANTTSVCPNGSESGSNLIGSESRSGKNSLEGTNASRSDCLPKGNDDDLSDVGSGFGACDLRMFTNDSEAGFTTENQMKNCKERFPSCGQKLSHVNNEKPSCRLLVPSHPMHLLYQKLTRSPPITDDLNAHSNPLRTTGNNQSFNSDLRNLPHPEIFPTNSIPSDQQRYLPSSGNGTPNNSRHVNSMLLNPSSANSNLNHYSHPSELSSLPAEMMISQYFQSHQRFAPPVWGFANPNYPNY